MSSRRTGLTRASGCFERDLNHTGRFEPVLSLQHQTANQANMAGVTVRMTTMTRLLSIVTFGAVLSMTAGVAFAGDTVSADKILKALKPTSPTRGLSVGPQVDTAVQAKEASFVETLRNRKTRSLSIGERQEIAELAATK